MVGPVAGAGSQQRATRWRCQRSSFGGDTTRNRRSAASSGVLSPAKDSSGTAVAYLDPKIVTVATPINGVIATRPLPSASVR
jgi:hypothetical protein